MLIEDCIKRIETEDMLMEKEYTGETVESLDFQKLEMEEVTFTNCKFSGCIFQGCTFRRVRFFQCDFSNCDFVNSYCKYTEFIDCKGDGSNFSQSSLIETKIKGGSYHYANFSMSFWDNSTVSGCDMQDSYFSQVKFKKTLFQQVNMVKCDFFRTTLKGMDLSDCLLEGITVSDTFQELKGLKINAEQAVSIATLLGVVFV